MLTPDLYKLFRESTGISTDTRKLKAGNIFFALKGENFNGNEFAAKALKEGAKYAVVDEKKYVVDEKFLLVENTLQTLQELAALHRENLDVPVIAVCGSNGKTTTKELIQHTLGTQYKSFSTHGNLNNHIGLPLTILSIPQGTEMAVMEMGANHLGETRTLCEIAGPDFGLITNNGKDHLEGYGSLENVRKGNGELYEFLRKTGGTAFVCSDEEDLVQDSGEIRRITYGNNKAASVRGLPIDSGLYLKMNIEFHLPFTFQSEKNVTGKLLFETKLYGHYNIQNVLAAVCVGLFFEVSPEQIKTAVENYVPSNNRSQIIHQNGNTFVLDAYNANPSSMRAALESFVNADIENKWVILGDMLELGKFSLEEHESILDELKKLDLHVILVGPEFRSAAKRLKNSFVLFNDSQQLKEWFSKQTLSGQTFLIKGSRKMMLEKIIRNA